MLVSESAAAGRGLSIWAGAVSGGPPLSIDCGATGHVENGLLGSAGTTVARLRQHLDHARVRQQKRGGERVLRSGWPRRWIVG